MKVLKRGESNQITCPCCSSLLEFAPQDISMKDAGYGGDEGQYRYDFKVKCPVCEETITLVNLTPRMQGRVVNLHRDREKHQDHDL
jgi:hypothetical protein